MPLISSDEALAMLRDAGDVVIFNGDSSYGLVEIADVLEPNDSGMMQQSRATTLLLVTGTFSNLRTNSRIVAAGTPYVVRDGGSLEDNGLLTRYTLARAS